MSNGKRYQVGGHEDSKTSHAVDMDFVVAVGERILAFPLCRRPRRLVQVWENEYDPEEGCTWCNRVLDRRNGLDSEDDES